MNGQHLSGQNLGQYELKELLGRGGMGAVYRAFQPTLDRSVAIKVMSLVISQEPGYAERFNREAKMAAALEHPHIVPVYDYGIAGDISYVVMRLLTGGSLEQRIQKSAMPLAEIAQTLKQVASALDYAHSQNLIHRDIKPSNIMFDAQGSAYVVDFGIAKLLQATHSLTGRSMLLGTPSYMSPEQWLDQNLTSASDQYALAVLSYQLITGELPFEATTPYALMNKHVNEAPKPPKVIRPDIPVNVSQVVQRALSKSATDRFASVGAFAAAFEIALQDTEANVATTPFNLSLPPTPTTQAPVPSPAEATQRLPKTVPNRRDRTRRTAAVISLLILVGLVAVLLRTYPMLIATSPTGTSAAIAAATEQISAPTEEVTAETSEAPTRTPAPTLTASATEIPATSTPTPIIQYVYVTVEATQCSTPDVALTAAVNAEPTLTVSQNFRLGEQALNESDYAAAITYFSATLLLDPAYVEVYYYRAISYIQVRDTDLALADYGTILTLDPDYIDAYVARAGLRHELGDEDGALEDVNEALSRSGSSGDADFRYLRGTIYVGLGDFDAAVADFNRALRLAPEATYMVVDRAWAYFELGDYEAAIRDFSTYLEYDPGSLDSYLGKGDAQVNIGDLEGALETFTAALELDETNADTLQRLGDALYELDRKDEALPYYVRYVDVLGGSSEDYIFERITEIEDEAQAP